MAFILLTGIVHLTRLKTGFRVGKLFAGYLCLLTSRLPFGFDGF